MYYKIEYIKKGQIKTTVISAKSLKDAISKFRKRDLGILRNIEEFHKVSLVDKLSDLLAFKKIDLEEYVSVLEQMYVMIDAGLSIDIVLENIAEHVRDRRLKKILISIMNDIKAGLSMMDSIKKFEKDLGILSVSMFRLGEETGDFSGAVKDLSVILSEILENRRLLKKATKYPILIIIAMVIAFTIVILFVIPPFKTVFEQQNLKLPLPTRILLFIDHIINAYGIIVVGGIIAFVISVIYLYKKNKKVKFFLDTIMLKIYIMGKIIELSLIGRFVYVFEKLITAGISVIDAFDIAIEIVDNDYIKKKMYSIKNNIMRGGGIAGGFVASGLFEPMIIQMVKSGEEAGALVGMLKKVSDYYLNKYKDLVSNISTLIEPVLIMAIAGFVLMLALGIFLPMWDMTKLAQGQG